MNPHEEGTMSNSESWFRRAQTVIPGGVNSPVRAFGSVGGTPPFVSEARGPYLYDIDGRQYVDLVGAWGPAILGHSDPQVIAATEQAVRRGLSFGTVTTAEVELAEMVGQLVPAVEKLRMVSSGTEATMSAIRLARGYTGRDVIIKFAGCYHGHVDALLSAAGSGVATFALPDSAGVPAAVTGDVIVLPYNDMAAVTEAFDAYAGRIAAVITEGVPANMGVVPPSPGFYAELTECAHRHGALLIFDEVMTGFRLSPAGMLGLAVDEGWQPDIVTFGKVLGGGLPVGAFGGRTEIMDRLAPGGPVYQAGTLSGNPVTCAAGLATLSALDDAIYVRLNTIADAVTGAVEEELCRAGVPHRVQRVASLFSVFFTGREVRNFADARTQNTAAFAAFFHSMLEQGVYLPPSAFEAWFVSNAHDDAAVQRILEALPAAAHAAAKVE